MFNLEFWKAFGVIVVVDDDDDDGVDGVVVYIYQFQLIWVLLQVLYEMQM